MSLAEVLDGAAAAGVPLEELLVGNQPGAVPRGPSGRWVLFPLDDGAMVLGGMDRGSFALYGRFDGVDATVAALRHVLLTEVQEVRLDHRALASHAQSLAAGLRSRAAGGLTAADVPVGTGLDRIGPDSGFCLFLLDTPFAERSSPPTDMGLSRRGWLVREPLPATVQVDPVVPWFEQPGGGIMVRLDRPVRWYADTGALVPFAVG